MKSLGLANNNNKNKKKRILIVDDEPDNSRIFKIALEDSGFVVDAFNSFGCRNYCYFIYTNNCNSKNK